MLLQEQNQALQLELIYYFYLHTSVDRGYVRYVMKPEQTT